MIKMKARAVVERFHSILGGNGRWSVLGSVLLMAPVVVLSLHRLAVTNLKDYTLLIVALNRTLKDRQDGARQ